MTIPKNLKVAYPLNNNRTRFFIFFILLFFFISCGEQNSSKTIIPSVKKGVFDVQGWNFKNHGSLKLNGEWNFYWNQHIPARNFENGFELTGQLYKHVPDVWNNYTFEGKKLSGNGIATYHIKIINVGNSQRIGLKFLDIATSFRIFVNGQQQIEVGFPGPKKEKTKAFYSPKIIEFESLSSDYDIVIHVSNFHHWLGGAWEPIFIGDPLKLHEIREKRIFLSAFLIGAITITGFYHLGLFWSRRVEISSLLFGIFCLLIATRIITHGERYIVNIFPDLEYSMLMKIIYLSFFGCVPVFVGFTKKIFPDDFSSKVSNIVSAISLGFILLVLFTDSVFFSRSLPLFQIFTILVSIYGIFALIKSIRNKRRGSLIFLAGFLALFIAILNDILFARMIINTGYIVPYGFFIFIFFQAYLISLKFSQAFSTVVAQRQRLKKEIEERKKAQKAAKRSAEQEKYSLVGQVAGKMAHDFNNVLASIMGNAELSLCESDGGKIKHRLEIILNQTIRGKNLTKNLVAFAKDQEPKQEFFDINRKIELVLSLIEKDLKGIELYINLDEEIPDLLADPGMVEHALFNLVQNSIHATSKIDTPLITIQTKSNKDCLYIEIADNGCGIPEEYLSKIYEPSFTLKGSRDLFGAYKTDIKGSGYGMANVKKYIQQHNGNISVESQPGNGTLFIISFPIIKKHLSENELSEIQEKEIFTEKSILIVEDEAEILEIQRGILTHKPFFHKVDTATDGDSAITLFQTNKYDLISLDYILPGDKNGMDIYKHIRKVNSHVPILFISGNLEFLNSIKLLQKRDPLVRHQSKPCLNKDYMIRINDLLHFSKASPLKTSRYN